jgi:hypothetical protein
VGDLQSERERGALTALLTRGKELETLIEDGRGLLLRHDPNARARFLTLLDHLIGREAPPPRPDDFHMAALPDTATARSPSGKTAERAQPRSLPLPSGLPAEPGWPGSPDPCLIPPRAFGDLVGALATVAHTAGPAKDPIAEDLFWAGLWTIGSLADRLRPLELVNRAVVEAPPGAVRDRLRAIAEIVAPPPPGRGTADRQPTGDLEPLGFQGSEPSGLPPLPGFGFPWMINPCRAAWWIETERAVRCLCRDSYRVDAIENCSEGRDPTDPPCAGECVRLLGLGFGETRSQELFGVQNEVVFSGRGREGVEATEYVAFTATDGTGATTEHADGWSDGEIRLRVPEGAVSGGFEVRVLCFDRPRDCPSIPTKLRQPASLREVELQPGPSASLEASGGGDAVYADDSSTVTLRVLACSEVTLTARIVAGEAFSLTDSRGESLAPDVEERRDDFTLATWRVEEPAEETYALTVSNPCGEVVRTVQVSRYRSTVVQVARTLLVAGEATTGTASIPCPESTGVDILLWYRGPIAVSPTFAHIASGSTSTDFDVAADPDGCGTATVEAVTGRLDERPDGSRTFYSREDHERGEATLEVTAVPVRLRLDFSARLRTSSDLLPGPTLQRDLSTDTIFPADRTGFDFGSLSFSIGSTHVARRSPARLGRYDPEYHELEIDVDLAISPSEIYIPDFKVSMTLSTAFTPTPVFGLRGGPLTRDRLHLAGEGTARDAGGPLSGWINGETVGFELWGSFERRVPTACA